MQGGDWKRYVIAFFISATIFASALYVSTYLNRERVEQIRSIEDRISTDILSLETQFDLLEQLSCEDIAENPVLTRELAELASRLNYTENRLGTDDDEVVRLKKAYTLLLIKDSILMNRISEECNTRPVSLFYFYSNKGDCDDCKRQGYVLTSLQEDYPKLRVYAFDYNLDLAALDTLIAIYDVQPDLPALLVGDRVHYGFKDMDAIVEIVPKILTLEENATTTATSTEEVEETETEE